MPVYPAFRDELAGLTPPPPLPALAVHRVKPSLAKGHTATSTPLSENRAVATLSEVMRVSVNYRLQVQIKLVLVINSRP